MSVDTSGLEAALRRLTQEKAGQLADAFVERARAEAPHRTGQLAESIHADEPVETATGASARVSVDAEYAVYVERGRGPERAEPGHAFEINLGGGAVIVTSVAAAPADPFWARTIDAWPDIVREVSG